MDATQDVLSAYFFSFQFKGYFNDSWFTAAGTAVKVSGYSIVILKIVVILSCYKGGIFQSLHIVPVVT